jgi:PhoPQ-activated pathogenicity-related protein
VTGGKNTDKAPTAKTMETPVMSLVCIELGIIGVILYDVPNQPMVYATDPNHVKRDEDANMGKFPLSFPCRCSSYFC